MNIIALGAIPAAVMLADRFGRKPVYAVGVLGTSALIWPFIWAVGQRNMVLIWVIGIVMVAGFYSGYGGAAFALWSEQFDTKVRMSGVAVGTQFGFALGGFAPLHRCGARRPEAGELGAVAAAFASGAALLSVIIALTMRETYKTPLYDLGKPSRVDARNQT